MSPQFEPRAASQIIHSEERVNTLHGIRVTDMRKRDNYRTYCTNMTVPITHVNKDWNALTKTNRQSDQPPGTSIRIGSGTETFTAFADSRSDLTICAIVQAASSTLKKFHPSIHHDHFEGGFVEAQAAGIRDQTLREIIFTSQRRGGRFYYQEVRQSFPLF